MTDARDKSLEHVPCIYYSVQFKDMDKTTVQALINSGSEVNTIHPFFAKQLGLSIRPIDLRVQKVDSTTLDTYEMIVAVFSVVDKANQIRFFEETFLVANVSPKVVFGILFLTFRGIDVDFLGRELRWRTYTTKEALPTTKCVELVGKKEFAGAALDQEQATYVVHVTSLSYNPLASLGSLLDVHPL